MPNSPLAGQPAVSQTLVDITKLVTAYYTDRPDPRVREQRVAFGTSGHRGSAFTRTFNELHNWRSRRPFAATGNGSARMGRSSGEGYAH
jgi:hypothetical protein